MKSDKILDAVGMINEQAVADAGTYRRSRAHRWVRLCAVAAVLLLSTTAMAAAWMFLRPAQVPEAVGDHALSAAFEGDGVININQSATSGGYTFTLLAMVSGEGLSDYFREGANVQPERTYAVLAIQFADGAPMTWDDYDTANFLVTPLLQGEKPWQFNVATLGGNASVILEDGVLYSLVEFNDIMAFADREVYLGVCDGFPSPGSFLVDEATGKISANPDAPGLSVVFTLPIDPSYADPERAQAYLAGVYGLLGLDPDGSAPEAVPGVQDAPQAEPSLALPPDAQNPALGEEMADAQALADATDWDSRPPVEGSYQELTPDESGNLVYSFSLTDGDGNTRPVRYSMRSEEAFRRFDAGETSIWVKHAGPGVHFPVYALRFTRIDGSTVAAVTVLPE